MHGDPGLERAIGQIETTICAMNICIEWFWGPAARFLSPVGGDDWPFGVPGPID